MTETASTPSARKTELLERAYQYAMERGIAGISLRPLASAIGSSPRVLLFLFGSKDGLIRALLARARADEMALVERVRAAGEPVGLEVVARYVWEWLAADSHRGLLKLWVEGYGRSLLDPDGPWAGFARDSVEVWLDLLAAHQPAAVRDTAAGVAERTRVLAVLRGGFLDLLATGEIERTTAAVEAQLGN